MFAPAGGWTNVGAEHLPPTQPAGRKPAAEGGFLGGLLNMDNAFSKWLSSGDPMFVVSATKA